MGVADDRTVVGLPESSLEEVVARLRAVAEFGVDLPLNLDIQQVEMYGNIAIAARVPDSPGKPHYVLATNGDRDGVFVRQNAASVPAGPDMVKALRSQWVGDREPITLGKMEHTLVDYLRERDRVTIKQFCTYANISQRRAHRIAVALVNAGILSVFQHDRDTYYTLNRDSARDLLAER